MSLLSFKDITYVGAAGLGLASRGTVEALVTDGVGTGVEEGGGVLGFDGDQAALLGGPAEGGDRRGEGDVQKDGCGSELHLGRFLGLWDGKEGFEGLTVEESLEV
jgi:hypothetical protein